MILGQLNLGYYYYTVEKMDSAKVHLENTLKLTKERGDNTLAIKAISNLSLVYGHHGEYLEAIRLMDSVAQLYLNKGDYLGYGVSINNSAAHYYDKGDYLNAMKGYKKALTVLDTIDREIYRKADVLRNIGKLNTRQDNLPQALEYFENALKTYIAIDDYVYAGSTYIDMGSVQDDLENYEKAIELYSQGLQMGEKSNNSSIEILALGNMGIAYKNLKKYPEAINALEKSLDSGRQEISKINKVIFLYHLGNTYTYLNNFSAAHRYLEASVSLARNSRIDNELKNALEYRSFNYEQQGALKKAITDRKEMQILADSIFTLEKARQINELQTIYETEKKESAIALQKEEINTLNEKLKVDKLTRGLYAGGMFTFVTVSGLLFFGFRQRIKRNRIAREKQEEIYKQEIAHKKKELTSQTLHLVQKNTFIRELMENLEQIKNSPEKFKMEFRRIVMLLKKENASDKDWEVFKTYFADVHNDFDQKLKTLYYDISEKEIRLAAFLRMNLTTKEIAATLNVLPDSILKSKYRLKKKLNLNKDTDLTSFLNTL
jgi:tetratricopeptide (TPR) repeat protein